MCCMWLQAIRRFHETYISMYLYKQTSSYKLFFLVTRWAGKSD